jgi:hypothetical protein
MVPVFSRRAAECFTPPGSPRTYLLAPLTFRERQAFRAEMAREGGIYPPRAQLLDGLREAVREASPGNADELVAHIDAAEADPDGEDRAAQQRLATIEAACAGIPVYATLIAARQRYAGMLPWVAARHALRGWEGDGLPPFARQGGLLPADLLDLLPTDEIEAVGSRAAELMQPDRAAEGNSAPPSSSPAIP